MFISLLPIMVQQASSLSYDVMNYLEVMLALGFITNLAYSKRFTNRNFYPGDRSCDFTVSN